MVVKIAVLGAGINGLASAVKIKQKYKDFHVVVISSDFTPNTTGDGAGGLWYPYLCGNTPEHLITKWGGETYEFLHQRWVEGCESVCFMPCFNLYRDERNWRAPGWANVVFGFRVLHENDLQFLRRLYSTDYHAGHAFSTFVYSATPFLEYFMNRFKSLNGEIMQATVNTLEDPILKQFDVVVNCLGVSAKYVVPDDRVYPIRGQVLRVMAPWVKEAIIDEDSGHYIIPNADTCVLGGTHQDKDFNTKVDDKDTDFILNGCHNMVPSLKSAKIITKWVGLRPGRDEIRLEAERRSGKLFIHNYGHGGSGLTLFWGCATDVLQLLEIHLNKNNICKL